MKYRHLDNQNRQVLRQYINNFYKQIPNYKLSINSTPQNISQERLLERTLQKSS